MNRIKSRRTNDKTIMRWIVGLVQTSGHSARYRVRWRCRQSKLGSGYNACLLAEFHVSVDSLQFDGASKCSFMFGALSASGKNADRPATTWNERQIGVRRVRPHQKCSRLVVERRARCYYLFHFHGACIQLYSNGRTNQFGCSSTMPIHAIIVWRCLLFGLARFVEWLFGWPLLYPRVAEWLLCARQMDCVCVCKPGCLIIIESSSLERVHSLTMSMFVERNAANVRKNGELDILLRSPRDGLYS